MIFVTVGTMFPFDRLIRAVDDLVGRGAISEPVFAQVGAGGYRPKHFESSEMLDKARFDAILREASCIVSHAGMGTITMALELRKPVVVMPRLHRLGEHVNDHQVATARRFAADHLVLAAFDESEIEARLAEVAGFVPAVRVAQPELVARRVRDFLAELRDRSR